MLANYKFCKYNKEERKYRKGKTVIYMRKTKIPIFIWLCYALSFYTGVSAGGTQFALLEMKTEFGLSSTLMATISSVQMVVSIVMTVLFAGILDKFEPKKAILAGGSLTVAGALLNATAAGPWAIVAAYIVGGIGSSVTGAVVYPAMTKLDPVHITEHVNRQQGMLSLGAFGSPLLMALLMNQLRMPWRGIYYINAGLLFVILIGVVLVPSPGRAIRKAEEAMVETEEQAKARKRIMLTPAFLCMGMGLLLYMFMEMGILIYIKDYFVLELDDVLGASLCISAVRGGTTLVRLLGSKLCKNRVWMSVGYFALSTIGILLLAVFRIPVVALVWCVLFGAFAGPCWPTIMSLGISLDPKSSGRLSSVMTLFSTAGNHLGSLVIGACVDTIGVGNAFYVNAIFCVLGALVTWVGIRDFRKRGLVPEGQAWLDAQPKHKRKRA